MRGGEGLSWVLRSPLEAEAYLQLAKEFHRSGGVYSECKSTELALRCDPQNLLCHVLHGQALMRSDHYEDGLKYFDRRIQLSPDNGLYLEGLLRWPLDSSLSCAPRRLLVTPEMGRGDMIQFVRYAPLFAKQIDSMVILVPEDLLDLFRSSRLGADVVTCLDDVDPSRDIWMPMMDLLRWSGANRRVPGRSGRYLSAPANESREWALRLCRAGVPNSPLIALNWSAQRWSQEKDLLTSRHLSFDALAALQEIPGARFCSVQKGSASGLWKDLPYVDRFVDCQELIDEQESFSATAAILEQVDACITVDTAVAHLSGALGTPTWILLNMSPCWRWGVVPQGISPSSWYDSANLVRNVRLGDWMSSISVLITHLSSLFSP